MCPGGICDRRIAAGDVWFGDNLKMEVAELKMLRPSVGVTRMDGIINEFIRGTAQVWTCTEEGQRSGLKMELPGRSKKERFTDIRNEGGHAESYIQVHNVLDNNTVL